MGGSGGGGTQTSTNTASYPEEFKPLATGAANQIRSLQKALPLSQFSAPNPAQTAGIAPFQQATMNMLPQLLAPSWGLDTLQHLGQPITQLAGNAVGIGNQTSPFSNALAALSSGGFGTGQPVFPGSMPPTPFNLQTPGMTQPAPQPTIMGPGTNNLIPQLTSQLAKPVPSSTPILPAGGATSSPQSGGGLMPSLMSLISGVAGPPR